MKIVPPNFGYVEEQIYRSGEPSDINFPFLETLKLKTCILLGSEEPRPSWAAWLCAHGVDVRKAGERVPDSSPLPLTEELCIELLQVLLDRERHPILVCDGSGRHRTGALIGCLRKLQRWNLASILTEYRRYAGNKGRLDNEQFIELFDVDLVEFNPNKNRKLLYCYDDPTSNSETQRPSAGAAQARGAAER
eukprot:TRINITY_DN19351_c0_g1_i1.p1 TRINITY_DN19351_c0_g1~~TRINITY_DN19351_c0_g1_i1.p1  ORF type:complete len:192 (+),score=63.83 TRINITY_DN19351_c0_g1_i1:93-668(+)